ncbi:hypothetical protein ACMX2H_17530 [Arthrobacter sulfonylureivorans]|uniref:hypothetical protein n=1 Tax=Arthrobacter sulfonylureivorans TaxID=2486855 RepID=UPI0039E6A2B7
MTTAAKPRRAAAPKTTAKAEVAGAAVIAAEDGKTVEGQQELLPTQEPGAEATAEAEAAAAAEAPAAAAEEAPAAAPDMKSQLAAFVTGKLPEAAESPAVVEAAPVEVTSEAVWAPELEGETATAVVVVDLYKSVQNGYSYFGYKGTKITGPAAMIARGIARGSLREL